MYTLGALLLLSLLLGAVIAVIDSVLNAIGLGEVIRKIPIIGPNWSLLIAIGMVAWCDLDPIFNWGIDLKDDWMVWVANGAIILGMIPLKDAVINMVNKGLRA